MNTRGIHHEYTVIWSWVQYRPSCPTQPSHLQREPGWNTPSTTEKPPRNHNHNCPRPSIYHHNTDIVVSINIAHWKNIVVQIIQRRYPHFFLLPVYLSGTGRTSIANTHHNFRVVHCKLHRLSNV